MRTLVMLLLVLAAVGVFRWVSPAVCAPSGSVSEELRENLTTVPQPENTEVLATRAWHAAAIENSEREAVESPRAKYREWLAGVEQRLRVRDGDTLRLIAGVRVRADQAAGVGRIGYDKEGFALGAEAAFLVEADGYQPCMCRATKLDDDHAAAAPIEVLLAPVSHAPGITLLVFDSANAPVQHLSIEAFAIDAHNAASWPQGKALWRRYAVAEDGRYELPSLPAGDFGIQIAAADEQRRLRALTAWRRTFALTGTSCVMELATLTPAAMPVFEFLDIAGIPFDQTVHGALTILLYPHGESATPRTWQQQSVHGTRMAVNTLSQCGPTWPGEALAEGTYTLEVLVSGERRLMRSVFLPSRLCAERIVVP